MGLPVQSSPVQSSWVRVWTMVLTKQRVPEFQELEMSAQPKA